MRKYSKPTVHHSNSHGVSITAVILARNEAPHLAACMDSLRPICRDFIVIDHDSADGTGELARSLGARVIHAPTVDPLTDGRWSVENGFGPQPTSVGRMLHLPLACAPWRAFGR